ncbi:MAG: BON domain-containing protein, partial [Fibrobacter sp.]|nr:BON domain-containing protein [Fibrobacter sp.]
NIRVRQLYSSEVPPDDQIKATVMNILRWDSSVDSSDILISVENGVVTVDGSVPAFWQKVRVEELLTEVNGVVMLHNRLTVVPSRHYVDELIARDIVVALDRNALVNVNNIEVQVNDGKVVLSGNVESYSAFKSAEYIVKNTDGVIDFVNNIIIVPL